MERRFLFVAFFMLFIAMVSAPAFATSPPPPPPCTSTMEQEVLSTVEEMLPSYHFQISGCNYYEHWIFAFLASNFTSDRGNLYELITHFSKNNISPERSYEELRFLQRSFPSPQSIKDIISFIEQRAIYQEELAKMEQPRGGIGLGYGLESLSFTIHDTYNTYKLVTDKDPHLYFKLFIKEPDFLLEFARGNDFNRGKKEDAARIWDLKKGALVLEQLEERRETGKGTFILFVIVALIFFVFLLGRKSKKPKKYR